MKRAQLSLSVLLAGVIGYIPIAASGQAPVVLINRRR